jgi:ubiquitin carboxyl-terminal hydrolase 5/13
LDKYLGKGHQENEELLPETSSAASEPTFDQGALDQLLAMGFPENRCKRAMMNTGNSGAEAAMNWLFEHMEDPGKKWGAFRNKVRASGISADVVIQA